MPPSSRRSGAASRPNCSLFLEIRQQCCGDVQVGARIVGFDESFPHFEIRVRDKPDAGNELVARLSSGP
jgi:hypothetical protein